MPTLRKRIRALLPTPIGNWLGKHLGQFRAWRLRRFSRDFSESGETVIIRRLLAPFPERSYVEIGANDGITASSTYGLALDGWTGLAVEANPAVFATLQSNLSALPKIRPISHAIAPARGTVKLFLGREDPRGLLSTISTEDSEWYRLHRSFNFVEVQAITLEDLLCEANFPKRFGLLLIDTEGMDFDILATLNFQSFRPRLLVTENYLPKEAEKSSLLTAAGYQQVAAIGCNTFWLDLALD